MNLIKTIFLARHGMTAYNEEDLLQGRIDLPLSEKGKLEAESLAEALKNEKIEIIFHSPLRRAQETAAIINRHHNLELHTIDCFTEIDMGDWEGQYYYDLIEKNKEFYQAWFENSKIAIPGGESFLQVFTRVKPGVAEVLAADYRVIAIVAHAAVNRGILGALVDMSPEPARLFRMRNGAFSKLLVYENNGKLRTIVDCWNNCTHLECAK